MGKLIIILLSFIFSLSLQARVDPSTGLNPKDDPGLKKGTIKTLNGMLPDVVSGVCIKPEGCPDAKIVKASLSVESAFDQPRVRQNSNGSQGQSETNK